MRYVVRLDDEEAAVSYAQLPPPLREHVSGELRRLAESPSTVSRRAHFPHPQEGQLFDVEPVVLLGVKHWVTIMFMYSRDERTLLIKWIVHRSGRVL